MSTTTGRQAELEAERTTPPAPSRLGSDFVKLNRELRAADDPAAWAPAIRGMEAFLAGIGGALSEGAVGRSWSRADSARLFSILLTLLAEAGQYRHEQSRRPAPGAQDSAARVHDELLPQMARLRRRCIELAKRYLTDAAFRSLRPDIETEIFPLLDSMDPEGAPDRFMPFRVIQIGNVVERLYEFRLRTADPYLIGTSNERGLLEEIYNRKYLRFGTSGVRARWGVDFTEARAKQVVQAICEFLKGTGVPRYVGAEDLSGRRIVVGYDSRQHAETVARWVAEVCVGNGFLVDLAYRDTPTPALVYHLLESPDADQMAGLINCTPSHNPPEWQGIKFNPRLGYPAASNVTDYIAALANELQLLDESAHVGSLAEARAAGRLRGFDPMSSYVEWVLSSGRGDRRIPLDLERIRRFFSNRLVVVDEMYGAGRGYLSRVLGEIGVRHTVIHAERDPNLPDLDYANPEEPYIQPLKDRVRESGGALGVGLDTDADRFGVVDRGGVYFRPNQVLPMLVAYLGLDRGLNGRIIATQTGSPLIEVLAGQMQGQEAFKPAPGVVPAYVNHPFYRVILGSRESRIYRHTFLVPVGVKYIEEQRRTDSEYRSLASLPPDWRDTMLIGGEESSGLSTRGHVPDKDGMWGDLLVMDMLAFYGEKEGLDSLQAIWERTTRLPGCWESYGGFGGSNSGRADVDAVLEAKEALIDHFLLGLAGDGRGPGGTGTTYAGLQVSYLGGTRYDIAEMQFCDAEGDCRHYLRVRASGTEPINRIYVESSRPEIAERLMQTTLGLLERLCVEEVRRAASEWRLVNILAYTTFSQGMFAAVKSRLAENPGWSEESVLAKLRLLAPTLERRSQRTARAWMEALRDS